MPARLLSALALGLAFAACSSSTSASPEPVTIRIAEQFGISYLPLQMIREHGLIEKHAEQLRLEVTTEWLRYSGGAEMNGALLDDELDIASGGVAPLLTIWDQTRGSLDVQGIACLNEMPLFLNRAEHNASLSDFISYAPTNALAVDMVDPVMEPHLPSTYADVTVARDDVWLDQNRDQIAQRFVEWLQENGG